MCRVHPHNEEVKYVGLDIFLLGGLERVTESETEISLLRMIKIDMIL